jgi:hypothetical protein
MSECFEAGGLGKQRDCVGIVGDGAGDAGPGTLTRFDVIAGPPSIFQLAADLFDLFSRCHRGNCLTLDERLQGTAPISHASTDFDERWPAPDKKPKAPEFVAGCPRSPQQLHASSGHLSGTVSVVIDGFSVRRYLQQTPSISVDVEVSARDYEPQLYIRGVILPDQRWSNNRRRPGPNPF